MTSNPIYSCIQYFFESRIDKKFQIFAASLTEKPLTLIKRRLNSQLLESDMYDIELSICTFRIRDVDILNNMFVRDHRNPSGFDTSNPLYHDLYNSTYIYISDTFLRLVLFYFEGNVLFYIIFLLSLITLFY